LQRRRLEETMSSEDSDKRLLNLKRNLEPREWKSKLKSRKPESREKRRSI